MTLDQLRQPKHVGSIHQSDAAKGAAVGVAVGTGIKVDAEVAPASGEERFDADPDRPQLRGSSGAKRFDRSQAVTADRQRGSGSGDVAVSGLPMGTAGDRVEALDLFTRGDQLQIPDRIFGM